MIRRSADSAARDLNASQAEMPLSWEFFRNLGCKTAGRGELRLALAVLEDAVQCLGRYRDSREFLCRLFRWEAEQWFESRDREALFSFENVCFMLDLDADGIRGDIRRWRERRSHPSRALFEAVAREHAFDARSEAALRPIGSRFGR